MVTAMLMVLLARPPAGYIRVDIPRPVVEVASPNDTDITDPRRRQ